MRYTKTDHLKYKFWNGVSKVEKIEGTKLHRKAKLEKSWYELKAICVLWDKAKEVGAI